jgi:two-component system response regulator RegA
LAQKRAPTILLVDAEHVARELLARQFREAGWSVVAAASCAEAWRSSSIDAPEFLIVEPDLGDGSGFSLFQRLQAVNPSLAAVMMTRQPSIAEAVRAIHAGFCDYRLESFERRDLLDPSAWRLGKGARTTKDPIETTASLARVEWNHIQRVLTHSRGNVSEAARVLGLHRRSLQRKLRRSPREDRRDLSLAAREK